MNNVMNLVKVFRNPQVFMQQAMSNSQLMSNPIGRNAIEMYQRGDIRGINELANNLCKEKGTSYEEMAKQIKSHTAN